MPLHHNTILVLGGAGFIGSSLIAQLVADGRRVIVPSRRLDRVKHLTVLPTVEIVVADIHDDAVLDALVRRADAVINLVGMLHSRRGGGAGGYGPDFARAHVALPQRVVRACRVHGVRRYLHMSALGASSSAPSMYLRSKAAGEAALHAIQEHGSALDVTGSATGNATLDATLDATVFRPSVVFGPGDAFLNLFAGMQRWFPFIPLAGAQARFQPIYVEDVARAMLHALDNQATCGRTYELAGPKVYTLRELVQLAGRNSGHARPVLGLPAALARVQALILELAPGGPIMSRDNLDSMKVDNVAQAPIAPELNLQLTPLEAIAPYYLAQASEQSRFDHFRANAKR